MSKTLSKPEFIGKKLLFVMAHPDDESVLAAGIAFQNFKAGGENFLICATSGENGRSHMKKIVSKQQLGKIREAELRRVAKFLGVQNVYSLYLGDGKLSIKKNRLAKEVLALVQRLHPDYIFSFDRDGLSGHLDHTVISAVSRQAAREAKAVFVGCCAPPYIVKNFKKTWVSRRKFGKYPAKMPKHVAPNLIVKVDPMIKIKAFSFHKSQLDHGKPFGNVSKLDIKEIFSREYFRVYRRGA